MSSAGAAAGQVFFKALYHRSHHAVPALLLAFSLLLALLIELAVFNAHALFFSAADFPRLDRPQQMNEKYHKVGWLFTKEHPAMVFNGLDLPADNIYLEFWSPVRQVVHVRVKLADDSSVYHQNACDFMVNPAGAQHSYTCRLNTHGRLHGLWIGVESADLGSDVLMTKAVINQPPQVHLSAVRFLAIFLLSALILLCRHLGWHRIQTDFAHSKAQRLVCCAVPVCALLFTVHIFWVTGPYHTPVYGINMKGETDLPITTKEHSALLPLPLTQEQLRHADHYTPLLDAFLNGRLYLNFPTDPKLLEMENPYNPTRRTQLGVKEYFDFAWYKGHYYLYFGLAPLLTVYLPVYLLTGQIPSVALTGLLLCSPALLALSLALHVLFLVLVRSCNLLLYLGCQAAVLCTSGIWLFQTTMWEYNFPYLTCFIFLGLLTACSWSLLLPQTPGRQRALLLLSGLCVPLIVMSRPLSLIFALALAAPPLLTYLRDLPFKSSPALQAGRNGDGCWSAELVLAGGGRPLSQPMAITLVSIPVTLGALLVMWYNHARFDSVFEFGQFYQLTNFDNSAASLKFSLPFLRNALWHYILEPLDSLKNFPFIASPSHYYLDSGNSMYLERRVSLLSWPLLWSFILLLWRDTPMKHATGPSSETLLADENAGAIFRRSAWAVALIIPVLTYALCYNAGVSFRYTCELSCPAALIAAVLLMRYVRTLKGGQGAAIVGTVLTLLLFKTLAITSLLPLSIDQCDILQRMCTDHFVGLSRLLTPIAF